MEKIRLREISLVPIAGKPVRHWQAEGGAANFPLLITAASPRSAVIFYIPSWPDADKCCTPDLARQAVLAAIEGKGSVENANIIAACLLLLGPKSRARQQRDAAEVRKQGSAPLVVAVLTPDGGGDTRSADYDRRRDAAGAALIGRAAAVVRPSPAAVRLVRQSRT